MYTYNTYTYICIYMHRDAKVKILITSLSKGYIFITPVLQFFSMFKNFKIKSWGKIRKQKQTNLVQ